MKPLAFLAILAALVALGCASVAREESTRLYGPTDAEVNAACEYQMRGNRTFWEAHEERERDYDDEAVDQDLDSLQVEAKYFSDQD